MKKYFLASFLISFSLLLFIPALNAQVNKDPSDTSPCPANSTNCLKNPLVGINTPQQLIGKIINSVLGVVGSLALLMFVYGGLTWMTSSGSQEKVKKGRDIIVWSAIGLAIIFASYGLVRILLNSVK